MDWEFLVTSFVRVVAARSWEYGESPPLEEELTFVEGIWSILKLHQGLLCFCSLHSIRRFVEMCA